MCWGLQQVRSGAQSCSPADADFHCLNCARQFWRSSAANNLTATVRVNSLSKRKQTVSGGHIVAPCGGLGGIGLVVERRPSQPEKYI